MVMLCCAVSISYLLLKATDSREQRESIWRFLRELMTLSKSTQPSNQNAFLRCAVLRMSVLIMMNDDRDDLGDDDDGDKDEDEDDASICEPSPTALLRWWC
jgi:hypothetical protein